MAPSLLLFLLSFLLTISFTHSSSPGNVTVVGTVFCDACSENTFSKHSYFLRGAKVQVVCKFSSDAAAGEEISINTERTTDRFGGYRLDIPMAGDFECREGRALESFCKASLVQSPSQLCDVPSLSSSAEHFAVKAGGGEFNSCVYDLNALSYKPAQRDASICGSEREEAASLVTVGPSNSNPALFFWPPFFPWPCWPPFPFPRPPSLPFPFPFPSPPSLPFPFPFPSPPSLPFPFPFPNPPPSLPFPFPFPSPPSLPFPFPFPSPPSLPFPFPFPNPQNPFFASPPPPAFPFPFFPPWPFLSPPANGAPPASGAPPALTLSPPPPPAFPFPYIPLPPFFPFPQPPSSPSPPSQNPPTQNHQP